MAPPNEVPVGVDDAGRQNGGTEPRKMKKTKKANGVNKKKFNRAAPPQPPPRRSLIRKRPVSFGNPALGTYHGCLYTLDVVGEDYSPAINVSPIIEGAESVERIVAMVDVPPEQVPEGILNLASSHRPYLYHVRIVIAENNEEFQMESYKLRKEGEKEEEEKRAVEVESEEEVIKDSTQQEQQACLSQGEERTNDQGGSDVGGLQLQSTPLTAASIMAADEEQEQNLSSSSSNNDADSGVAVKEVIKTTNVSVNGLVADSVVSVDDNKDNNSIKEDNDKFNAPCRTYLVLLELCSVEAAEEFVEDLHGRPYTSLDPTQKCNVHQVLAVSGEDGVSLLSPFFAPTAKSTSPKASAIASTSSSNSTTTTDTVPSSASSSSGSGSTEEAAAPPKTGRATTPPVSSSTSQKATAAPAPIVEDYNCAVCLEHMILSEAEHQQDENNSNNNDAPKMRSILTTVCNHSFHLDCLLKWQDSPCPVCRYDHSGLNEALSQCHVCGRTENNYVCLICGVVSCGGPPPPMINGRSMTNAARVDRMHSQSPVCGGGGGIPAGMPYSNNTGNIPGSGDPGSSTNDDTNLSPPRNLSQSHARRHYDETLHAYALDTETQHVWDFAGQGYVHRLLQNKEDGKLVEFHDPSNTSSHERSLTPGLSDVQEGEVVHRKLEGFASQYYTLLKSQLEQQRTYYQGRLEELRRESLIKKKAQTSDLIQALKQEKAQLSKRLVSLKARHCKVVEDTAFLKNMNESLEANKEPLKRKIKDSQRKRIESRDQLQQCLPVLEDKVSLLLQELTGETHDNNRDSHATAENPNTLQHSNSSSDDKKPAAKP